MPRAAVSTSESYEKAPVLSPTFPSSSLCEAAPTCDLTTSYEFYSESQIVKYIQAKGSMAVYRLLEEFNGIDRPLRS